MHVNTSTYIYIYIYIYIHLTHIQHTHKYQRLTVPKLAEAWSDSC